MGKILITSLLLVCNLLVIDAHAKTIPELNSNTAPTTSDLIYTVDVSDTTDGSSGTGKKATIAQVFKAANMTIDGTNVGVASTAPGARVDVVGTVRATAFSGDGSGLTGVSGAVSDAAYGSGWNGDTTTGASKNALYDKIETLSTASGWTDGGTNVYLTTSTDNVGLGSTTPRAKLDVIGTGYFDGAVTVGGSSQIQFTTNGETISNTNDGYNDFSAGITTVGNIGVGTTSTSTKLHVQGGARITGLVSCDTIDTDSNGNLSCGTDDSSGGGANGWTDGGTNIYNTATSDNVGIGTTTPTSKLTVAGAITTSGTTAGSLVLSEASANGTDTITLSAPNSVAASKAFTLPSSYGSNGDVLTSDGSGVLSFTTPSAGSSGWTDGGTNVYTSTTTDMVGIGTTTPSAMLNIVKSSTSDLLKISSTAGAGGDLLVVRSSGNVGIGTNTPASIFSVGSTSQFQVDSSGNIEYLTGVSGVSISSSNALISTNGTATFGNNSNGSSPANTVVRGGAHANSYLELRSTSATGTGDYIKMTVGTAGGTEALRIVNSGNIGIGTTVPSAKAEIGGNASKIRMYDANGVGWNCGPVITTGVFTCS